jgi:hypothetical protein
MPAMANIGCKHFPRARAIWLLEGDQRLKLKRGLLRYGLFMRNSDERELLFCCCSRMGLLSGFSQPLGCSDSVFQAVDCSLINDDWLVWLCKGLFISRACMAAFSQK